MHFFMCGFYFFSYKVGSFISKFLVINRRKLIQIMQFFLLLPCCEDQKTYVNSFSVDQCILAGVLNKLNFKLLTLSGGNMKNGYSIFPKRKGTTTKG